MTRSSLLRCLQRHGTGRIDDLAQIGRELGHEEPGAMEQTAVGIEDPDAGQLAIGIDVLVLGQDPDKPAGRKILARGPAAYANDAEALPRHFLERHVAVGEHPLVDRLAIAPRPERPSSIRPDDRLTNGKSSDFIVQQS